MATGHCPGMLLNYYDLTLVRFGAPVLGRDRLWDRLSRKRAIRAEDGYTHRPGDQPSPRLPHEEVEAERGSCAESAEPFMPARWGSSSRTAELVPAGSFTPPGSRAALESLPQFCRVQAHVSASADSLINFEVWVPNKWIGKIVVWQYGRRGKLRLPVRHESIT